MMRDSFFKILIVSFADLSKYPQVKRQITFLKSKYEVSTVGLKSTEEENVGFYNLKRKPVSLYEKSAPM